MYESVKYLEIKPFTRSKLVFGNNTISPYFFFFFLIIDLFFLILVITELIFNPILELLIPLEISTKKAKIEMEIHTVTTKTKVRKCSM